MLVVVLMLAAGLGAFLAYRYGVQKRNRRRREGLANAYNLLICKHRFAVACSDIIGNRIVALDARSGKLACIDHAGQSCREWCIAVADIAAVHLEEVSAPDGRTERVSLVLELKSPVESRHVCFYDLRHDPVRDLTLHLQLARHWQNRLASMLHPAPNKHMAHHLKGG